MSDLLFAALPIYHNKWMIFSCCCKHIICNGCAYANRLREEEQGLEHKCPYCREPVAGAEEEADKNVMKRVKAKMIRLHSCQLGQKCYIEGDYEREHLNILYKCGWIEGF